MSLVIALLQARPVLWPAHVPRTATAHCSSSTAWSTALQKDLDEVPVFTCANRQGDPLGYERDGKPLAIFFADAARAKQELEIANGKFPELGLRVIGVGLGEAYKRTREGSALLVASAEALAGAGDDWDDAQLPLYTCLTLSQEQPDGTAATPLFLCPNDARTSLENAISAAKAAGPLSSQMLEALQLMCTSLDTAIDVVLSGREKEVCGDRFLFLPPSKSISYLQQQKRAARAVANDLIFPGAS